MSEAPDFEELIRRVRAWDQEAAAELVRRYEPAIRRAARIRLVDSRLRRLFDSPALQARLSRGAVEHAGRFGWGSTVDRLLTVYSGAMSMPTEGHAALAG